MSDHTDPPGVGRDKDITDIYAFHPPGSGGGRQRLGKMVFVLAVNPFSPAGTPQFFSDNAEYQILIDTDGDAEDDIEIEFEFEEPEGRRQEFEFEIEGDDWEIEGEGRINRVIRPERAVKVFAGVRADPFFIDFPAFVAFLEFLKGGPAASLPGPDPVNTFADFNVSAIVVEVPTRRVMPEDDNLEIGVWGAVEGSGQVDRSGRPAISTALIPSAFKEAFNEAEPEDDVEDFTAAMEAGLASLGLPTAFAGILLPDLLTVNPALPTAFLNGRNLDDDVVDATLSLLASAEIKDGVGPPPGFLPDFPYLARPHR